jgi:hypothetical protein
MVQHLQADALVRSTFFSTFIFEIDFLAVVFFEISIANEVVAEVLAKIELVEYLEARSIAEGVRARICWHIVVIHETLE